MSCPLQSWSIVSPDTEFMVDILFFQHWKCCATSSGLPGFKWEDCCHLNLCFLRGNRFFFSSSKSFSLSLIIRNLVILCFGVDFFGFILFEFFLASWMCRFVSFTRFRKFSAIIFLNTFSAPLFLLMWTLDLLLLSPKCLKLCQFVFSILSFIHIG